MGTVGYIGGASSGYNRSQRKNYLFTHSKRYIISSIQFSLMMNLRNFRINHYLNYHEFILKWLKRSEKMNLTNSLRKKWRRSQTIDINLSISKNNIN
mmetsp:Transcript_41898/g.82131  ORF Transcript_41898/g.82131 Transcript_41898/m.82131 type:complete len:97 (-) Transcript_41898:141-431(-)